MVRRYGWSLVQDEEQFLDEALAEFGSMMDAQPLSRRAWLAVKRTYSVLLDQGLRDRNDTAAWELYLALFRQARPRWSEAEAEDLAQEAFARIWPKLATFRSAQALLTNAYFMLLTVERSYRTRIGHEAAIPTRIASEQEEIMDPADLAADVEQRILSETIVSRLRAALPNDLQRRVVIRTVIFGENPRDIARDLGLPPQDIRLAKSRGLKRLHDDPGFGDLRGDLVKSP
jgi:DNA-directed RNA polymerase specialized sigma24 family protein